MEEKIHGFSQMEIVDLYHYLCIYVSKLEHIENQTIFEEEYPKTKELKKTMSSFVCNNCTKESLKVIGLAPMDDLVSMTKCRSSKTLSFLHHLRNSIAHGQLEQEGGYVFLIDYGFEDSTKVFSARGKIKSSTLFEIVHIINNNIKLS
ncbi:MAG: hypothetical protein IK017_10920 [Paludibacteraceae bacterium]|nr:hypothetical protein [Paludibacteraceae bacterium]